MDYLTTVMRDIFDSNKGMGGYAAPWKAYQIELALEELIYSHPLSPLDYQLIASLGTCSVLTNSGDAPQAHIVWVTPQASLPPNSENSLYTAPQ